MEGSYACRLWPLDPDLRAAEFVGLCTAGVLWLGVRKMRWIEHVSTAAADLACVFVRVTCDVCVYARACVCVCVDLWRPLPPPSMTCTGMLCACVLLLHLPSHFLLALLCSILRDPPSSWSARRPYRFASPASPTALPTALHTPHTSSHPPPLPPPATPILPSPVLSRGILNDIF